MSVIEQQTTTGTWRADKVHSTVGFEVKHMVVSTFRGGFEDFDATLTFEDGEPRVVGTVRSDSIEVRDENLAAHLQSPDFFDSEQHPEIRFESVATRREGDELTVEGDLTIKGVTKRVEARGAIVDAHDDPVGGTRMGVELSTLVDRTEYGLKWNQPLPKGGFALAHDVRLVVNLEFVKAE
ncbi:MAG: YceI family protein [Thermoleophilaceae bacterium]